jgi:hypothetical protein
MSQTSKISMREINNWLNEPIVVLTSDPHIHRLPLEYYYTPIELKRFYNKKTEKPEINEHTRRNDANNIFCELVDYCVKYNINDLDNKPLFKPSIKNSFYNFIYENSSK